MDKPSVEEILVEDLPVWRQTLRVATVTETFPPEVNGVSLTVARMVQGLRDRHHSVQLVRLMQRSDTGAGRQEDVLLRGVPIPRYPNLRMGLPSTRQLIKLWQAKRPDVVHIATEGPLGWSALRAAERLKLPVVSDFRTNFHAYSVHYGLGWLNRPIVGYLKKFHNRTLCTMVPTETLLRELNGLGFRNLRVVSRGVDTEYFDPRYRSQALRNTWGADDSTLVVLCVSRLAAEKNLELLQPAMAAMSGAGRSVRLVIVGDGPARADLQVRLPGTVFSGSRRGSDLAAHYASADLFVFPSLTETFGNVIPEAMASGLPILAFDCAAAGELVTPDTCGWLARPGDVAQFCGLCAEAVGAFTRLPAMGQAARARACRLEWRNVVETLESVMLEAIRESEPASAAPRLGMQCP